MSANDENPASGGLLVLQFALGIANDTAKIHRAPNTSLSFAWVLGPTIPAP